MWELNYGMSEQPDWVSTKKSPAEQNRLRGEAGEMGESQEHHV